MRRIPDRFPQTSCDPSNCVQLSLCNLHVVSILDDSGPPHLHLVVSEWSKVSCAANDISSKDFSAIIIGRVYLLISWPRNTLLPFLEHCNQI